MLGFKQGLILFLVGLLGPGVVWSHSTPSKDSKKRPLHHLSEPKDFQLEFPVEKITLKNGITFLLHSQRNIPMISYHTWFRVGSKDELKGESGLAHMLEHMMFKGTERYPNKVFDQILQANGIVNNAFTTQDYTGYFEILPSSKLEIIMDMEADRLQSLLLLDSEFQKEREVVLEEKRMRYDNSPEGMLYLKLTQMVYGSEPYSLPVIGTTEDIKGYSVDKMSAFYKKWYNPSNAVVTIVGDFDTKEIKNKIEQYYGKLKSSERPIHAPFSLSPVQTFSRSEGIKFNVNSPELMWGYKTIKTGTPDGYALDLLSAILGQGKSSHLYRNIVRSKELALSIESGHYSLDSDGMFYIQATARPGITAKVLKAEVEKSMNTWLKSSVTEDELTKAKNMVLSEYINSLKTNDGKAKSLALNEVLFGDYRQFFKDLTAYNTITISDLQRVKSYLEENHRFFTFVSKEGKL